MKTDGNSYADLSIFKTMMEITGTGNDTELLQSLESASRSVDSFCKRHFYIRYTIVMFPTILPWFVH